MTILDKLLAGIKPKEKPLMTNEEILKLKSSYIDKYSKHFWSKHHTCFDNFSRYLSIQKVSKTLNGSYCASVANFYVGWNQQLCGQYRKILDYYIRSKDKRKQLHSENLKLKAKIERLDKGRLSRLEKIGDIMLRLRPGWSVNKNFNDGWVITHCDDKYNTVIHVSDKAPDGIYKDLLVALKDIDQPCLQNKKQ